jgi:hypothetical protein
MAPMSDVELLVAHDTRRSLAASRVASTGRSI